MIFAENLLENILLPYPQQHCVFSIPKRIRPFFKFNRKLMRYLYESAWQAWKDLALEQCPNGIPGAVLALHTAGDLLAWHPHIHGLFLSGVILPDGACKPLHIDAERLQALFADKVLGALQHEGLLTEDNINNIKTWPHSGFNAFIGDHILPTDTERLLFAARYLKKCSVSNKRLKIIGYSREPVIEYTSYRDDEISSRSFTPLQFLAEISQHVPDTWEQTTRFMGVYSARTRGAAKARQSEQDKSYFGTLPEPALKPSANWARLMKKVFELDPLVCRKCGSAMKIKAFITDHSEIDRITRNLGIALQRAPPLRISTPAAA